MDKFTLGILAFPILFSMLALRVPIGLSMLIVGCSGTILIAGWLPILSQVKTSAWHLFSNYSLSVTPLFLLMGNFAGKAGMSEALFKFTGACLGHRKGGVAMAAIGACAGFGAICGSSLATAATMGKVALPELRRLGYSGALSTGTLAAGGTLGILIPPSVILIIYSILTEQNIAKMFLAAFVPGILAALGYILAIALYVRFVKGSGPTKNRVGWKDRFLLFKNIWQIILIFVVMIGGIYLGWFTPTEGGAIGAGGTGLIAALNKSFKISDLIEVIENTAITSAMIFLVLLGAEFFNSFIALTQLPNELGNIALNNNLSPLLIVACILILYLFLGCLMDSLAMILLTIPVFYPVIVDAGIDPVWFGIFAVIVVEFGLISPPVGMNLFVIKGVMQNTPLQTIWFGTVPFLITDVIRLALIIAFPAICLYLPSLMTP